MAEDLMKPQQEADIAASLRAKHPEKNDAQIQRYARSLARFSASSTHRLNDVRDDVAEVGNSG